jgi:hypothetical protein
VLVVAILLKPENKNRTETTKMGKICYTSKILFLTISVRIIGLCGKKKNKKIKKLMM